MLNFLTKLIFFFKKPKIIIVTGNGRACATQAICQVLKSYFKVGFHPPTALPLRRAPEILIFEVDLDVLKFQNLEFLIKNSSLPILVATHVGEIPPDQDFFAGEKEDVKEVLNLAKILPENGNLILNFDDETVREIEDLTDFKTLTFGFQEGANFQATDVKLNTGTNFKLNYRRNIVPVWLDYLFGKEQIYSALSAISVGIVLNLNLVEICQALKFYKSLPGKMRLIKGVKNSLIFDDSESASVFSMAEALEILGKIPTGERKIAILGDILGIGKYTIEAHESIGERVSKNANLLFTVGPRAKFIAQGAISKGMPEEKIFQFEKIEEAGIALQKEIKEGDLILVDGSTEMKMEKIIEEIATRAF